MLEECAADRSRPFFLAVGFYRPHTPFVAPRGYFDLYPTDEMPVVAGVGEDHGDLPAAALQSGTKEQDAMTDGQRREARQAYLASISFMDAQVGRVMAALDRLGLRGRSGRSSHISANRSNHRPSLPPVAHRPTGESSCRSTTNAT